MHAVLYGKLMLVFGQAMQFRKGAKKRLSAEASGEWLEMEVKEP